MAHVMRYCHLSIHMMWTDLFEWRRATFGAHANAANGRLQLTAGIHYGLLIGLCAQLCTVRLLRHAHLAGRAVRPWVTRWLHVLIVVAHSIVRRKSRVRRHIALVRILAIVMHLLAAIQMITIRIVAVHIRAHIRIGKVWCHTFTIICTHSHFCKIELFCYNVFFCLVLPLNLCDSFVYYSSSRPCIPCIVLLIRHCGQIIR